MALGSRRPAPERAPAAHRVAQPDPNRARTQRAGYPRLIPGYRDLVERCSWTLPTQSCARRRSSVRLRHMPVPYVRLVQGTLSVVHRSVEPLRRVPRKWVPIGNATSEAMIRYWRELRHGSLTGLPTTCVIDGTAICGRRRTILTAGATGLPRACSAGRGRSATALQGASNVELLYDMLTDRSGPRTLSPRSTSLILQ
jgi:hypothetical protein